MEIGLEEIAEVFKLTSIVLVFVIITNTCVVVVTALGIVAAFQLIAKYQVWE